MKLQEVTKYAQDNELVTLDNERPVTNSLKVSEYFEKDHRHVLRDIREKILPYVSESFNQSNFGLVSYIDAKGEERPMYILTRDGFTMVAMGYTGVKAMKFKEDYITAFNKMEEALRGVPLTPDQIIDRAANKLSAKLFPQFMKTVTQSLSKGIVDQVRDLPQGETLLPVEEPLQLEDLEHIKLSELPHILTVDHIIAYLNIGKKQAYELMHIEDFPAFKVGNSIRIEKRYFVKWLEKQAKQPINDRG